MGGPELFFGPLQKVCRTCDDPFVFSAREQKHIYETLRLYIDATTVHCPHCRAVKRAQKIYAEHTRRLTEDPSPATYLEVARAAVTLLSVGGQVNIDKIIGYSRRAKRSEPHAREATQVEETLIGLRETATRNFERA